MKIKILFLSLALFVGTLQFQAQITLSHHVDPVTVDIDGLACGFGSGSEYFDTHFARVYNLNEFGITGDFLISAVEFGQGLGDDGKTVIVNVYISDSEFLPNATLTLVSTTETSLMESSNYSLITVSTESVVIPAGSIVVVETFAPDHATQNYFPGFNLTGHSGTAWVKTSFCNIPNWVDANNSGAGDEQHLLINLVGTEILGVSDMDFESVLIYPNPTTGVFTIDLVNSFTEVDITITNIIGQRISFSKFNNIDKLELSIDGDKGIYFVTINTSNGKSETLKIIKM